ncbi:Arc family DNA-binding protein [Clostridium baratii]|uniref:Arc family DNA-binding protein n=1 Tax=Clostridium baratii TaxID=1561 RepID=UPI0030CFD3CC
MPSNLPKFTLRVPAELLDKVRKLATINGRSVNKEIEQLLIEYVNKNSDKL